MFKRLIAVAALAAVAAAASVAQADPAPASAPTADFIPKHKGLLMVNVRATDVIANDGQAINTAAGVDTGLRTHITDSAVPSLGITYFVTDHLAAELILATSRHSISAIGGATDVVVKRTWVLPPTLSLQYHFAPQSRFSPYVGAGVNYMLFYGQQNVNGFTVKLPSGFGASVEAGADYAIGRRTSLNLDVKKIFFSMNADINNGALKSHVNLDPWVPSVGLGYKF